MNQTFYGKGCGGWTLAIIDKISARQTPATIEAPLQGVFRFIRVPVLNPRQSSADVPHDRMEPLESELETLAQFGLFTESFSVIKFGEINAVQRDKEAPAKDNKKVLRLATGEQLRV